MSPIDISGLCLLVAATVICAFELVLSGPIWALPPEDPCRERPSALPDWRQEPRA